MTRRPSRGHAVYAVSLSLCLVVLTAGCGGPAGTKTAATTSTLPATSSTPATKTVPATTTPRPPAKPAKNDRGVPMAGALQPASAGAYIGAFTPPGPWDWSALQTYQENSRKPLAVVMWYQAWAKNAQHEFDPATCVSAFQHGIVPLITWEPWDPGRDPNYLTDPARQPKYRLARIIDGTYDPYIRSWARGIRSVAGPVMLRPMHEMNAYWYPWAGTVNGNKPAEYVKAWRHIHDIFVKEGATNVTWVWSINGNTRPDIPSNQYAQYYPGDEYVDWTATNGFNWGKSAKGMTWVTFEETSKRPLTYLKTLTKPVLLVEFASVEKGGSKASWITESYARVKAYHPEVRAVLYYDHLERDQTSFQDWQIGSSKASRAAYKAAVGSSYFVGGPADTLANWSARLSRKDWEYLRSLPPVY